MTAPPDRKTVAPFPLEDAHSLIGTIRKAFKSRELSQEVSTRGLVNWGKAYFVLQEFGVAPVEALGGGFHLAIEAKYHDEERTFVRGVYNAVFGKDPILPTFKTQDDEHPTAGLLQPFMQLGIPLWVHGPKGSGKSYAVKQQSDRLGRTMLRVQITHASVPQDLLGDHAARGGTTFFEYGPLPLAMQNGWILNVDEISTGPSDVQFVLHAVLEGNPLVLTANRGEVIEPKPGFGIVFTDNSLGLGEATDYIGTKTTNEAFRDRPLFVAFDYMPAKRERHIVNLELEHWIGGRTLVADAQAPTAKVLTKDTPAPVKTAAGVDVEELRRAAQLISTMTS